jgi:hypothetical protein
MTTYKAIKILERERERERESEIVIRYNTKEKSYLVVSNVD